MKIVLILIITAVLLTGCSDKPEMTRAQVIAAVKQCQSAGLDAEVTYRHSGDRYGDIVDVNCLPRNPPVR